MPSTQVTELKRVIVGVQERESAIAPGSDATWMRASADGGAANAAPSHARALVRTKAGQYFTVR